MATTFQGKSMAPRGRDKTYHYQINTAGLKTGAAVVYDSSVAGGMVKAPAAAAAIGFAGLIATEYLVGGGSAVGQDVQVQREGIGLGILRASNAVTFGQKLVIAATDGSLRPYVDGTDATCDIIGTSEVTLGSQSGNVPITVNLDNFSSVP